MGNQYSEGAVKKIWIDPLKAEIAELKKHLWNMSKDMHHASMRPCPTCRPISELLNEPYGCYVVNGEFKPSPPKEQDND